MYTHFTLFEKMIDRVQLWCEYNIEVKRGYIQGVFLQDRDNGKKIARLIAVQQESGHKKSLAFRC
jgi:hypothetical protein